MPHRHEEWHNERAIIQYLLLRRYRPFLNSAPVHRAGIQTADNRAHSLRGKRYSALEYQVGRVDYR